MRPFLVLFLLAAAAAAGDLFDGKSLDGWVTKGGPYDGNARWTVEDGAIVGREGPGRAGGLLYTKGEYTNFLLEVDVFVTWPFDSGIFLRMRPDAKGAQVTLDWRPGGEIGGIYSDGWWLHNPAGATSFKRNDWNRFRIRCAGDPMHVVVHMNGKLLTDYRFPAAAKGFARRGRIGLQVHGARGDPEGSHVKFRRIRIHPLAESEGHYFEGGKRTEAGVHAGWNPLFAGAEPGSGFAWRDGALALLYEGKSPHLATKEDYRNFHLVMEFKHARLANSGVFLRADRKGGNPAFSGCEVQILDDHNWEKAFAQKLKAWQLTGSLYGAVAPRVKALRPVGAWNSLEIVYREARLVTVLNGKVLYDVDTHALDVKPPFAERARAGFIGLQRHAPPGARDGDAYLWFRNMFIRKLD